MEATIIDQKQHRQARDPQMHRTKEGNPWYVSMKAHIGTVADGWLVYRVIGTAATSAT